MGGIKLKIHPLFYVLCVYYAFTGRISLFVICSASAVLHELGHSFSALNKGYKLNEIVLMPFGAVAKGDIDGLKLKDELSIALAGPAVNFIVAFFTVAFWWLYPETYAYTEEIATVNLFMALVNLIPAYPLDGGRVLHAILSKKNKNALKICKIFGVVFGAVTFCFFVVSLFKVANVSLLLFSCFVTAGALSREEKNVYVRIDGAMDSEKLKRGVEIKRYAFDYDATVKKVINTVDTEGLCEIIVYKDNGYFGKISAENVIKIVSSNGIYQKIGEAMQNTGK